MKSFIFSLIIILLSATYAPASVNAERSAPITDALLELCKKNDINISIGAMLISIDVNDYHKLEKYVRSTLSSNDEPWITCIKLFVLSKYTYEDKDTKKFIESIPTDKNNFWKLIDFESSIIRHPGSHIISHLAYCAKNSFNPELRKLSLNKINAILSIADGWVGEFIQDQMQEDK